MHIRPHKDGYRVEIQHKQYRESKTFPNKGMCKTWADDRLKELKRITLQGFDDREPVANLFARYYHEISPTKKGSRWERIRLNAMSEHEAFKNKKISQISPEMVSKYRDDRLQEVSAGTVLRELSLLSGVFDIASKEWHMIDKNPIINIRKPKSPQHRDKVISEKEVADFLASIPYNKKNKPSSVSDRVGLAFLFAIQTGMRAGEICGLAKADIYGKVATLKQTKNGKSRRVPLSKEALRIVGLLGDDLFGLTSSRLDAMFRKLRDAGGFEFRFHDTRHTAVTHLAKKLDVMNLSKVIGHSDPRQLMKYYHPDEEDLADLLG